MNNKYRYVPILLLSLGLTARAGNIVLTGHDNDLHDTFDGVGGGGGGPGGSAGLQLKAIMSFVRSGSSNPSLPVLSFDSGTELTKALTGLGIPFTNVDPNNAPAVAAVVFNPTVYSAIVVASQDSCGGCDNSVAGLANIASRKADIGTFLDAGGGIVGLSGAGNSNYYDFVPTAATNPGGSPPATGYVQTTDGASVGIPPVNGDETHNFFSEPGSAGLSGTYKVFERLLNPVDGTPETIGCQGCTVASISGAGDSPFQVRYASNLPIGDSVVNITNTGANSTVSFPNQNGNLCVNVYTFSPDEQMISCCSCLVTPDALVSLSARNDLISNTLTPGVPTSVVIKLLASAGTTAASCNASTVGTGTNLPVAGLGAFGTTIHALPVTPGSPAITYGETETRFANATLSAAELSRITTLCGFIQTNGSGFGICKSCRFGGLGGVSE
jgi:hypothetical protein